MKIANQARLALRHLSRRRVRTLLMTLGVFVAIASLTVLESVGEATRREAVARFKNMVGTFDTVIVRPGAGRTRGMVSLTNVPGTLKFEDAQAIAAELPGIRQVAQLQNAFDIDVKYRDRTDSPAVFGVSANWLTLRGEQVAQGSFFTSDDDRSLARVAVLGGDVLDNLFSGESALGLTFRIADVPFQIVGVLKKRGAGPAGGSLDHIILIPVTTASRRLFHRDFLTMLIAQLREPERSEEGVRLITAKLRERHHLAGSALDDFTVTSPTAVMTQVTRMGSTLSKILREASVLSLFIGAAVILALMLMAVTERRREIGVLRSVGASGADILVQFLLEAIAVSVLGGALGAVLASAGTNLMARIQHLPMTFAGGALLVATALSVATGLVSGLYPAWKASSVDPVEALRA
ncbi:MAG TPA: ABC transporter permease [Thermoanaerobaculia bacterium]